MSTESGEAGLLEELRSPRRDVLDRLVPVVYEELRAIAHRHIAAHGVGGSLSTTGLASRSTRAERRNREPRRAFG